jgi:hypothetical protein
MKMTVITDKNGHVVATYRQPTEKASREGQPVLRLHGGPDQTVHELDLPSEFEKVASADELHTRLREHLKKVSTKRH